MDTEPRNFSGNYPLAGERIGPAWRLLWRELDPIRYRSALLLAAVVAPRAGVAEKTIQNLLWRAERAGQLEKRLILMSGRKQACYRVKINN